MHATMTPILEQIKEQLPRGAKLKDILYEGADIVLYTENAEFLLSSGSTIREIVSKIKKRVEVRAAESILESQDKTEKLVKELAPAEAGIRDIFFEPEFSKVIVHAEKPGLVIGKAGELLRKIKEKTFWTPEVRRAPAIDSDIIKAVRAMLHKEADYRRKFLHKIGERIYGPRNEIDWIRVTALGGFREVGRSCVLVSTNNSSAIMDCGLSVSAHHISKPYPYLEAPEFNLQKLDSVVISHAHLDHSGTLPYLYEYGYRGPVYCTRPTRDLMIMLQMDYMSVAQREGKKSPYSSKGIEEMIKHCVTLEWGQVTDIAPDLRLTLGNAGHLLGSASCHLNIADGTYNLLYSLDWTSPIVLINPQGELVTEPIGKVVDNAIESGELVTDGFVERVENKSGWKAIAFNPETLKAEVVPVTSFLRHPVTEKLYRIRAEGGKEVTVTTSHNVFQVIDGKVRSVRTKDVRPGQFILAARELPIEEKEPKIDLTAYSSELRLRHSSQEIISKVYELRERAQTLFPENSDEVLSWVAEHFAGDFLKDIAARRKMKSQTVRKYFEALGVEHHPRRGHSLPSKLRITPRLARFIGYYVAEGSSSNNTVRITNYDQKVLSDSIDIARTELGIEGMITKNKDNAIFTSRQLEFLLKRVLGCGENAYSKRIPRAIMTAPADVVWEFLRGYYIGDGNIRVRTAGCSIAANSKSLGLIRDIALLLARFGIVPSMEFNKTSEMYMAHVHSRGHIENMLNKMNIPEWTGKFISKPQKGSKACANDRVPITALAMQTQVEINKTSYQDASSVGTLVLPKLAELRQADQKLLSSCFAFAKVLSIEEIEPTSSYVYDICIDGYENFLTGQGFLFVHNTGDLKYQNTKLFDRADAELYQRVEGVITESTYGDGTLPPYDHGEEKLRTLAKAALARGGRVLIPCFAVGRAQSMIVTLMEDPEITVPVYLDGMIWDATAIHTAYPEYLSRYLQGQILRKQKNPFIDPRLKGIGSGEERRAVLTTSHPCVVLSTSGMLQGGPAMEYLKNFAHDARNLLLFVGYQAEGTLGRRIQKGWKYIPVEGRDEGLELKLEVQTVEGYSGHSDARELMAFIRALRTKPKKIIANHGESMTISNFVRNLHKEFGVETQGPKILETVRLR